MIIARINQSIYDASISINRPPLSFYGNYLRNIQTICVGFLHILYGFLYIRRNDFLIDFPSKRIGIVNHVSHC